MVCRSRGPRAQAKPTKGQAVTGHMAHAFRPWSWEGLQLQCKMLGSAQLEGCTGLRLRRCAHPTLEPPRQKVVARGGVLQPSPNSWRPTPHPGAPGSSSGQRPPAFTPPPPQTATGKRQQQQQQQQEAAPAPAATPVVLAPIPPLPLCTSKVGGGVARSPHRVRSLIWWCMGHQVHMDMGDTDMRVHGHYEVTVRLDPTVVMVQTQPSYAQV